MNKIEWFLRGVSFDDFASNRLLVDFTLMNLDKISAAAAEIPNDLRTQYANIGWQQLLHLRAEVTPADGTSDVRALWKLIKRTLPALQKQVQAMLDALQPETHDNE